MNSSAAAAIKRPLLFVIAGLIIVVIVLGMMKDEDMTEAKATHEVRHGDFLVTVVESGTLEAVKEIVVRNELEGTSRIIYLVPEGSEVKAGDLVVEFDGGTAEDQLNQQEISYERSVASYIASTNNLLIARSTADSDIRAAELNVKFAKMDLDKFDSLEAEYQKRNAEMDITTAKSALEVAQDKLESSQRLAADGFETKRTLDIDTLDVERKQLDKERMETYFEMLTEFDLEKQREQLQEDWKELQKELERVTKQAESKITQAEADVRAELNTLTLNSNKFVKMQRQMDSTKLYAPQTGFVVYPQVRGRGSQESMIEEGATSRYRQELIKLPDTSRMKVVIKVNEANIGQVSVGQAAFITLDSIPDSRFRGEVTKVAPVPDTQQRFLNPNLVVYSTEITILDKLPADIKPGVSARGEIVITNLVNVIRVPNQSVTSLKSQAVCYIKDGKEFKPVSVEIGQSNTKFIEIRSGLNDGDLVMLAPPFDVSADLSGNVLSEGEQELDLRTGTIEPATQNDQRGGPVDRGGLEGRGDQGGRGGRGGFDQEALIERFDTDGDGELSAEEEAAMREQFGGRGGRRGGGGGGRGDF